MKKYLLIVTTTCFFYGCKSKTDLTAKLEDAVKQDFQRKLPDKESIVDSIGIYKIDTLTALKDSLLIERKMKLRQRQQEDILKFGDAQLKIAHSTVRLAVHSGSREQAEKALDSMKQIAQSLDETRADQLKFQKRELNISSLKDNHKIDAVKPTGYFVSFNMKIKNQKGSHYRDSTSAVINNDFKIVRYENY